MSSTSLGAVETWPLSLRTLWGVVLGSIQPMFVVWGPERTLLYNQAYAAILADKHPAAFGRDLLKVWAEIRADLLPIVEQAYAGQSVCMDDITLVMHRRGYPEEGHFSFSYTPVRDDDGHVAGFLCACLETTAQVAASRRRSFLADLEHRLRGLSDPMEIAGAAQEALGRHLGANRVGYGEVDESERWFTTARNWTDGTVPTRHGAHDLAGFGPEIWTALKEGRPLLIRDAHADPRISSPEATAAFDAIEIGAAITASLVKNGRMRAALYVHARSPRRWSDDDVALVEEVAERTWGALERARAEKRLRVSEARFRGAIDGMTEGFGLMAPDFTILELNAEAMRSEVRPREAIIGKTHWEAYPGSEESEIGRLYKQAMRERVPVALEHRYEWEDGRAAWLDMRAYPTADGGIAIFYRDITDRKAAEGELRETEERLRLAVENAEVGFWDVDEVDDTLIWPARTKEMFGISADVPVTMRDFYDGLHPADRETISEAYAAAADPVRRALYDVEYRTVGKEDGVVRWVAAKGRGVFDDAGRCLRVAGTAIDITARKGVEARLRASEELNRRILASSADCIKVLDLDARLEFMSEGGMCVMEVDELSEVAGAHWPDFWQDEEHGKALAAIDEARSGGTGRFRGFATTMKGSPRWWDVAVTPINGVDGRPEKLLSVSRDITQQHQAEAELRALNAELERKVTERALARGRTWAVSPELMGVINAQGYFEQSNPAWASLLGWSEQEITRTVFFDFVHPDDLARTRVAWADTIDRGMPALGFENRYRHKDGSWRWLSWVAVPDDGKVYCSARDVSAEKAQAAALAERTLERDRMWETSPDLMLVIDFKGVFRRVNPAWSSVLGYEPEELVGHHVNEFVLPDDHDETTDAYELAAAGGRPVVVNRYRHKDGSIRWISWTAAPAGELTYATGRDITARKEHEAELKAAQEALRQSQKMEAMGSLTGGVAHDFNNLLTPIIGSLDMLVRKGLGSERERRLIDGALQSAERAKTLVQRLLAFARRQPLQPVAVDINRLVDGMAGLIGSTLGPMIDIRVDLAPDLPPAKADLNQLEMALLNLAVNARDAMPDGGTLTISAKRESVRGHHRANLKGGHYVRLCVADSGIGMDEATLSRAVEPFFSTKGIGRGTGLGLSMVHGLAAQLGGGLTIDSVPGRGTRIELWLPISAMVVGEDHDGTPAQPVRVGRGTVLLVDDEELVRMSTADMLIDLGFEVLEAGSAEEALRLMKEGAAADLLVTDHLMPGMNGADLAREARSLRPALPVLVVSGYAEVDGIAPGLPRLTKPFRNAELAASLAALLPALSSRG